MSGTRPRLTDLLPDGHRSSRRQRATALVRPFLVLALYGALCAGGLWALTPVAMVLLFGTTVVVMHDLFHRNLGLPARANSVLVGVYGLLVVNSGHALARSHLRHHRVYPHPDDPEAYVDGWPIWRVLVEAPVYRFRVWAWSWRHRGTDGVAIAMEMAACALTWIAATLLGNRLPALRTYVLIAELGTWTFPLISVTGVHDRSAPGPLQQTRTLRAPTVGRCLLGMQHHLEHHLYPRVPACRLPELARALDPWLSAERS